MHAPFLHTQELFFIIVTNSQAFFWVKSTGRKDDVSWIKFIVVHHNNESQSPQSVKQNLFFFFSQTLNQYSIVFLTVNLTCPVFFFCLPPLLNMVLTNYPAKVLNLSSRLEMFLMVVGVLEKYLISFNVDLEASLKFLTLHVNLHVIL